MSIETQNKADERKAMFQAFSAQQGATMEVSKLTVTNSGFVFTRRIIALPVTAVVVILATLPIIQPVNVL